MKKTLIILFLLISYVAKSQVSDGQVVFGTIYQGDTIPMAYLNTVKVTGYVCPLTEAEKKKYKKLIKNVKKVYPYAKEAGRLLDSYTLVLKSAKNCRTIGKILPTFRQPFCPNKKPFHHIYHGAVENHTINTMERRTVI